MASGRLGAVDLGATSNTTVYTVPALTLAAIAVNVCNRGTVGATVRLALASSDTPGAAEWIEYDTSLPAKSVLERTGLVLDAGKRVVAYASVANLSVMVVGIEEAV